VYDENGKPLGSIDVGAGGPIIRVGDKPVVDLVDQLRRDTERILGGDR
jgi:hypothetical protein